MIRLGIDSGTAGWLAALREDLSTALNCTMPKYNVGARRKTRNWQKRAEKALAEGKKPPPKYTQGKKFLYDLDELDRLLCQLLEEDRDLFVAVEAIQTRQGESAASAQAAGRGFGGLEGLLKAHRIPFEVVTAQRWQKHVLKGAEGTDTKTQAIQRVRRSLPTFELSATNKAKRSAAADAAGIALYAWHLRPSPAVTGAQLHLLTP